ncbi:hypothetical protein V8E54_013118 [Elaphomyces granulatus]
MGYWSIHDLLGLFLSSLGPAPDGATKRTFFLPLTAMYGRWCRQIVTPSQQPFMFQCTWNNQPPTFFLGANSSGYSCDETTGTWRYALTRARFALVDGDPLKRAGWSYDNCPVGQETGRTKQKFGNCAECYPLVNMMRGSVRPSDCFELALRTSLKPSFATGSLGQLARSIAYMVCEIRDTSLVSEGNLDTQLPVGVPIWMLLQDMVGWRDLG